MVCRESVSPLLALALGLCTTVAFAQAPLPGNDGRVHEGVASCANTVCHGRVQQAEDSPVWLNEYRVWLRQDYHSRAYRTLLTEQSRDIAAKLGLPAAQNAKICLDCHADNIPASQRGQRFQLDDGVGCEACHGGAGEWLESHAEKGTDHRDNIARGLYPTEDPAARARLCLSCHLGNEHKFATHAIMGAGHPRLSFELETFGVNQPAHYSVDDDYRERKRATDSVGNWLTGLAANSAQFLEILSSGAHPGRGPFPELAFYQCHACHHGMDNLRWQRDARAPDLEPGTVRLNDGPLLVLSSALSVLDPQLDQEILASLADLHAASLETRSELQAASEALGQRYAELTQRMTSLDIPATQRVALRRQLLQDCISGKFSYYTAAEQAFLGIETLSIELGDAQTLGAQLDALFTSLENETDFVPAGFSMAAKRMLEAL
jgi:hypothetical protein